MILRNSNWIKRMGLIVAESHHHRHTCDLTPLVGLISATRKINLFPLMPSMTLRANRNTTNQISQFFVLVLILSFPPIQRQ